MNAYQDIKKVTGFTLIEVLVVISIIGILSALIYVNFSEARDNARNKSMQTELKEIQLGLELYRTQNSRYPEAENLTGGPFVNCRTDIGGVSQASLNGCLGNIIITNFVPEYISEFPNPENTSNPETCDFVYKTDVEGTWYKLSAVNCLGGVDASSGTQPRDEQALCPPSCASCASQLPGVNFHESLAVYSPGGNCQ